MKTYSEATMQAMAEGLVLETEQYLANPKREHWIHMVSKYVTNSLIIMGNLYSPMGYYDRNTHDDSK